MDRVLVILVFLLSSLTLSARDVIIEVSSAYKKTEVGTHKIKMCSLKDAFDYCNKYNGEQKIEIILIDKVNIIDTTLTLRRTEVPITIKASKGTSVITSGKLITNNLIIRGDTIIFPWTSQCRMLLVNGKKCKLANTFETNRPLQKLQSINKVDEHHYNIRLSKSEISELEIGCDLFLYTRWQCYKMRVTSIDITSNKVALSSMGRKVLYATDPGVRYAIYNSRKVMGPGMFCWNNGEVIYLKKKNGDNSNLVFTVPTVATLVRIFECKNVTLKNISFENAVLDDWYFQEVQGSALCSKAVHVEYSQNINFENCDFHNNMGYSLAIGNNSSNCTISGCCLTDLQGGGIILGMEGGDTTNCITVTDNLVKRYGRTNVCCAGILCQRAHHVNIINNTISDGFYTGISLGWTWGYDKSYSYGNYVSNNHIHHLMQGVLDDGGGIYTLGIQSGTIIENNYIHDVYPDKEMACLIYLDEGSSELIIRNNICFSSKIGINASFGRNNIIENNVIGFIENLGVRLSYPKKVLGLLVRGNKIMAEESVALDSNIQENSLIDNEILSVGRIKDRNIVIYNPEDMTIAALYKSKLLNRKFVFGCISRRLKRAHNSNY